MTVAAIIYPHQLFESNPIIDEDRIVYLIEDPLFFSQYTFHRQKLMLHRASMKRYAAGLDSKCREVRYVDASELKRSDELAGRLHRDGIKQAYVVDPQDDWLRRRLIAGCNKHGISLTLVSDPHFLTPVEFVDEFIGAKKKIFFTQFYIERRKRLNCLIEAKDKPVGGKWSFDTENRKKLPKAVSIPEWKFPKVDTHAKEARHYVEKHFEAALGEPSDLLYPTSHSAATAGLDAFIEHRLSQFGDYEDAIAANETHLFHSCLTPALNIGLLSPKSVLEKVIQRLDDVPMNSLEGFIRQVIGWREFIRAVYLCRGVQQRTTNYWEHTRKIPSSFYDGSTGIVPVDTVIRRVLKSGYCHHIERLMVLGNFMLLCEFDPDEVYRWFMELFIDAYDWVMVPNVYGMSQHADGGLMTTKPYISGSSYILRMSDFKRGPWCEVWDGLYWQFMAKHRTFFERNPRMSVMTRQLDKMGDKLDQHRKTADTFLGSLGHNSLFTTFGQVNPNRAE